MKYQLSSGSPSRLGARFDGEGTNFAVFSANASRIDLCLFSDDGAVELDRLPLPERTGAIWHGYAAGLRPGTRYGFRAHGTYAPEHGHRFNPHKLLMDPYTRELAGNWSNNTVTLGYVAHASSLDLSFDTRDSGPYVPKSIVSDPELYNAIEARQDCDWAQTLIYEAHAKGLTKTHPGTPDDVKGTYEGLASDAMLEHLNKIGVTAVELLPVHSFIDDGFLEDRGLRNYWGYNTIGFFAPEPRYFGPAGFVGFRNMVRRFHAAGIKVILDVVYNHTAEGDHRGPTLCYRGLDNANYYRLIAGQPRYYVNDTGCGNTVNIAHPYVLRMVMDSLRFWVQQMGVDGFRFDLATTLCREEHGFDRHGGFLDALRQDPVLSDVRMIAEPWDIGPGGYRLGQFPAKFSEWNDGFRDCVRRYWRGDSHSTQELAAKLLGSADTFDREGRPASSSVNLLTAHDGFTLADVTSYNDRHNDANGENGMDGHHNNLSDNCGVEGHTDDPEILDRRKRRQRNMLATLFLSQGTPMLLAGDEFSNSQQGNNNAYAQDNEIGWLNWDQADEEMIDFVARLSQFRKDHPCLSQERFLHGGIRKSDAMADVEWTDFNGTPLQWRDPGLLNICLTVRGSAERLENLPINDTVFIVLNRSDKAATAKLPPLQNDHYWVRGVDTSESGELTDQAIEGALIGVAAKSVVAVCARSKNLIQ